MATAFEIEFEFMEKLGRFAKPEYLQIYLYSLCHWKKESVVLTRAQLAQKLDKKTKTVQGAIDYWMSVGILTEDGEEYAFSDGSTPKPVTKTSARLAYGTKPSYEAAEIEAVASLNKDIDYMFHEAEKILGKLLSPSDQELFFSFADWLGLPVEVIIMLLRFAKAHGKTGKRYLETVAIDWAEKGIDTYESAEEYIREIELRLSNEGKIRGILGIYDRALTQTEKKYIKIWTEEKNIPPEFVAEAYDRTVNATGKLNWAYMNKILLSWTEGGYTTLEEIAEAEELYKAQASPIKTKTGGKRNKFVNYEDTNKPDYSNFAEQLLKDMLDD